MSALYLPSYALLPAPVAAAPRVEWDHTRKDFWNHPLLWDGISDTHAELCWMRRFPDRIEV